MATSIEEQCFDRSGHSNPDCIHLLRRSVFVISTLNNQHWACDSWQVLLDVPVAEPIAQPHIRPRLEQGVHVPSMMALEPGAKATRPIGVADGSNAGDGYVLDEYVWSLQDERPWRCQPGSGIDESDGTTVAVTDEDGLLDSECVEKPRQHFQSFAVHEAWRQRGVQRIRSTIAPSVVYECSITEASTEGGREVAPTRDRAEPLMQEDDRRGLGWQWAVPLVLQAGSVNRCESGEVGRQECV